MGTASKTAMNREAILRAASGGKTLEELLEARGVKGKLKQRQLREYLKVLEKEGLLICSNKNMMGRGIKHRYHPASEFVNPPRPVDEDACLIDSSEPVIDSNPVQVDLPEPVIDALVDDVTKKIREVDAEILKDRAWTNKRRIKSICFKEIRPLIHQMNRLHARGYDFKMPTDYFTPQRIERWKHELAYQYVPGALGIPIVDERAIVMSDGVTLSKMVRNDAPFKDPVMYPSLLEWREYFHTALDDLLKPKGQSQNEKIIVEIDEKRGISGRNNRIIIGESSPTLRPMNEIKIYHYPRSPKKIQRHRERAEKK